MKTYKVLTSKSKIFGNKVDPERVEQVLNQYAAQGWKVVTVTDSIRGGSFANAQQHELFIVLEHDA